MTPATLVGPTCDLCGRLADGGEILTTFERLRRRLLVLSASPETAVVCSRCRVEGAGWRQIESMTAPEVVLLFVLPLPTFVCHWLALLQARGELWQQRVREALSRSTDVAATLEVIAGRALPRAASESGPWAAAVLEGITRSAAAALDSVATVEARGRPIAEAALATSAGTVLAMRQPGPFESYLLRADLFRPTRCYATTTVSVEAAGVLAELACMVEKVSSPLAPNREPAPREVASSDVLTLEFLDLCPPYSAYCRTCGRFFRKPLLACARSGLGGCEVDVASVRRSVAWTDRTAWSCPSGHMLFEAYRGLKAVDHRAIVRRR